MSVKPVLAYWDIRGLCEPIRFLYHYLEIEFEDKRYFVGPNFDLSSWFNEKYNLGLAFPNLPYLIDGDFKLSQSNVIIRHLARKYNLGGESEEEKIRVELVEQQVHDLKMKLFTLCYIVPDFEKSKSEYLEKLPKEIEQFANFLGDSKFVAGEKVTYADFMLYDVLDFNKQFQPSCLDGFDSLKKFMNRIESLPTLSKYLNSPEFPRFRVWSKLLKWSGAEAE